MPCSLPTPSRPNPNPNAHYLPSNPLHGRKPIARFSSPIFGSKMGEGREGVSRYSFIFVFPETNPHYSTSVVCAILSFRTLVFRVRNLIFPHQQIPLPNERASE
jgi:hypothetical protein